MGILQSLDDIIKPALCAASCRSSEHGVLLFQLDTVWSVGLWSVLYGIIVSPGYVGFNDLTDKL